MNFRFSRHILRFWIENEPGIEKAFSVLIHSNRIANPLINHTEISLTISMTATNIINNCETANHLKSKRMEIQSQDKVGQGNSRITDFVFSWPGNQRQWRNRSFLLKILTRKKKIIWRLKVLIIRKILGFWKISLGVGGAERVAFAVGYNGMKDDLTESFSPTETGLAAGGHVGVFDLRELMFPAMKT